MIGCLKARGFEIMKYNSKKHVSNITSEIVVILERKMQQLFYDNCVKKG
jgi:hypothetical protein